MFKKIKASNINAEEVKNRITAYVALTSEPNSSEMWYGELSKYVLNLRLSGVSQERKIPQAPSLFWGKLRVLAQKKNASRLIYYESEAFLQEHQYFDDETFIEKVYQIYLRRNPDTGGKQDKLNQLTQGNSKHNIITALRTSSEGENNFLRSTACLDHKTFLDIAYRVYLTDKPSLDEQKIYLQSLKQGQTRQELLTLIQQSKKAQEIIKNLESNFYLSDDDFCKQHDQLDDNSFIDEIYYSFLKRPADPGGKEDKLQMLQQGISRQDIVAGLRQSEEAFNVFLNITSCLDSKRFIEAAYLTYLKDKPNLNAEKSYLAQLNQGESRQQVILSILQSKNLDNSAL